MDMNEIGGNLLTCMEISGELVSELGLDGNHPSNGC
jgi:hypothetical protein